MISCFASSSLVDYPRYMLRVRVVRAVDRLEDGQRPCLGGSGRSQLTQRPLDDAQIAEGDRNLGMVRAVDRLLDGQRPGTELVEVLIVDEVVPVEEFSGWYPSRSGQAPRPVPVIGDPWPGVPARGRGAAARADACWLPVARRLTPHGLRHSHKTIMDELGTPQKLKDERMGHEDGSVCARYSHVTDTMRQRLMDDLTALWSESLLVKAARLV